MLPIRSKFLVATLLQRQTWVVPHSGVDFVRLEGVIKGQIPGQRTSKRFKIYVVVVVVGCCLLLEFVFSGCFLLVAICNAGIEMLFSCKKKRVFIRKKTESGHSPSVEKSLSANPPKFLLTQTG